MLCSNTEAGTYPFNFLCFLSAMDFLHSATEAGEGELEK